MSISIRIQLLIYLLLNLFMLYLLSDSCSPVGSLPLYTSHLHKQDGTSMLMKMSSLKL